MNAGRRKDDEYFCDYLSKKLREIHKLYRKFIVNEFSFRDIFKFKKNKG